MTIAATKPTTRRKRRSEPSIPSVPDDYDSRFLACRDLRHAWAENGWYRGSSGGVHRFLTCMRCGTERHDDFYGSDCGRHYVYPAGYALEGRVDVAEVRFALRDRANVRKSLDELRAEVQKTVRGR